MDKPKQNTVREMPQTFNVAGAGDQARLGGATGKQYRAKVFKSGNSLALRLPAGLALAKGMEMELSVQIDGSYALRRVEPPRDRIDVSGFAGKCPGLKLAPREDFDERPSTITARALEARKAAGLA